jgi:long-chain acyl-CoA synthetase
MNLASALADSVARHSDKIAISLGAVQMTFAEFDAYTTRLAQGLLAAGVGKGDRVALNMANTIEMAACYFACFKVGAIAVPLNPRLKPAEIAYMLEHSEPVLYVGDPGVTLADLPAQMRRSIRWYEVTQGTSRPGFTPYSSLLQEAGEAPLPDVKGSEAAAILYTSGTTAHPKGVTHSHDSLRHTAMAGRTLGFREDDVLLIFVPLAHASGLTSMLIPALLRGAESALVKAFDPAAVLETLERRRCTATMGLPAMLRALCREQAHRPVDVGSLRSCWAGGDSVSVALQEEFNDTFGVIIQEGIGMTELETICCNRPGRVRCGSVGEPADGIEVRIVTESGADVAAGEVGEMVARGPFMLGYWNDPEATAEAIRDGWLYTGDLARRDSDGYVWFAGRKKELIVRGGLNIAPQEVEEILLGHPAVSQAGVVGMPDPEFGEAVIAFIKLRDGRDCTASELIDFARRYLSDHKVPAAVRFIDEMPLGPTAKVSRRALKESLQSESQRKLRGLSQPERPSPQ